MKKVEKVNGLEIGSILGHRWRLWLSMYRHFCLPFQLLCWKSLWISLFLCCDWSRWKYLLSVYVILPHHVFLVSTNLKARVPFRNTAPALKVLPRQLRHHNSIIFFKITFGSATDRFAFTGISFRMLGTPKILFSSPGLGTFLNPNFNVVPKSGSGASSFSFEEPVIHFPASHSAFSCGLNPNTRSSGGSF